MYWQGVLVREPRVCFRSRGSVFLALRPSTRPNEKLHSQSHAWELRASMSLARLWRDQGKVREARELLAPVYGRFTEGFDTRDLKDAKALLEQLAT